MKSGRQPISGRCAAVVVEYDCRGQRKAKWFASAHQARAFYISKFKQGKNPAVRKGE